MFEGFKNRREIRKSEALYRQKEQEFDIKKIDLAITTMDQALEARKREVVRDTDLESGEWFLMGTGFDEITQDSHQRSQQSAFKMYNTNPHARAIVRGLVKFTLGKGPQVIPEEEDKRKRKKALDVWTEFTVKNKFSNREKEIATRTFRDGETFIRKITGLKTQEDGDLLLRFIRSTLIANPNDKTPLPTTLSNGIETEKDDIETVINYWKTKSDGSFSEKIPANEIYHLKIFSDSDQKRGNTVYGPALRRLTQYEEWLEDRIILNKVRSAIALVKTVEGGVGNVTKIHDENRSDQNSSTRRLQKTMRGGTVITTSKGVKYELLSTNINASDVKEDGRSILLSIAAAVGFPEMLFTADFSNSSYSSSLIAQNPFVREIEEWQDFFRTFYEELYTEVIDLKIAAGKLAKDTVNTAKIVFPPMLRDDLDKLAKAFEVLFKFRIVSKSTWQAKMGLDPEREKLNMLLEEGEEVFPDGIQPPGTPGQPGGKSPFNMPMAPINQFGSEKAIELMKAMREGDWTKIREIAEELEELDTEEEVEEETIEKDIEELKNTDWNKETELRIKEAEINADAIRDSKSDINVTLSQPDFNPNIVIESPSVYVDNAQPDIKINPEINVATPEVKPKIVIENKQSDIKIEPKIEVNTPEVKVDNIIAQPEIIIENKIEQPTVEIENIITNPEVKVNVEFPTVNIENIIQNNKNVVKRVIRDEDNNVIGIEEVDKSALNLLSDHGYVKEAHTNFAEQDFIYLIHHIHSPKKAKEMEVLHHCIMHEKKGMKGKKYKQKHVKDGKVFLHVLVVKDAEKAPKVVYDHLNNGFKIKIIEIDKVEYAVIYGLVNVKKTKWSNQDK